MHTRLSTLLWATTLILASTAPAQALLKDIDPTPSIPGNGSSARAFTRVGSQTLFVAKDPAAGEELFVTDGTAAGTHLVRDLFPGRLGSDVEEITPLGALAIFRASTIDRICRSDGTAVGTYPLTFDCWQSAMLRRVGNQVLFAAYDVVHGSELWRTDGTLAGTTLLADINPGIGDGVTPQNTWEAAWMTVVGANAYFVADDGAGNALWVTDGTAAGTTMVTGLPGGYLDFTCLAAFGSALVFSVGDSGDYELWTATGTTAALLADLNPIGSSNPRNLVAWTSFLYFVADDGIHGEEPWLYDGITPPHLLADLNPGPAGSSPDHLVASGGGVMFAANDGVHGQEPYLTLVTAVLPLGDLWPGPTGSVVELAADPQGGAFAVVGEPTLGIELWQVIGTTIVPVTDIQVGPADGNPTGVRVIGTTAWFQADDGVHGTQPWVFDPATGGHMVKDLGLGQQPASGVPVPLQMLGQTLLFSAFDQTHGAELWRSDGTPAGTQLVKNIAAGNASSNPGDGAGSGAVMGGILYFGANTQNGDRELWRSDGSSTGTYRVRDLWPGGGSGYPQNLTVFGDRLLFSAFHPVTGSELWTSDGTAAGTDVMDLVPGFQSSNPTSLLVVGGQVFFTAQDLFYDHELYVTDGTLAGTQRVLDINPSGPAYPEAMTALGGTALVVADDGVAGMELWASGGTAANTVLLRDAYPGPQTSNPSRPVVLGPRAFYACEDGSNGRELWVTDGTPAGTAMFLDLNPGPSGSSPANLTLAGDRLFFTAYDQAHGAELWVSDGTVAGTQLVRDLCPGPCGGITTNLLIAPGVGRRIVFTADDGVHGNELWISDGTANGTVMAAELVTGAETALTRWLARAGATLFFAAEEPQHGLELWSMAIALTGAAVADEFGAPCASAPNLHAHANSAPRIGNGGFGFTLDGAPAGAIAALFVGDDHGALPIGGCTFYPSGVLASGTAVTSAAGAATLPLPLPNTASLVGFDLTAQWAVVTAGGPVLGILTLSDGLFVVLGN